MAASIAIPTYPLSETVSPKVYQAFSELISDTKIKGIGANVKDLEILRLACLEKQQRDREPSTTGAKFILNFLANIQPSWANGLVNFWHEGLGYGWNFLVIDTNPNHLLRIVLFNGSRETDIFACFSLPARLPGFDCELHEYFTVCRHNPKAPPLTASERKKWEIDAQEEGTRRGSPDAFAIDWGITP